MATPTLVQHISVASSQLNADTSLKIQLPNASLGSNLIVVAMQGDTSAWTAAVTDDQSNTYTAGPSFTGAQKLKIFYSPGATAGVKAITITFSAATPSFVTAAATEFFNVATTTPADGSSGNGSAGTPGTSLTAGSFTTTTAGDLIYQYGVQDGVGTPINSWTAGASPWALLSADILDSTCAQYQVQASAGAINPTLTMSPSNQWDTVAMAFKSASAGTAPAAGIRIVRVQHQSIPSSLTSPVALQFPCTGNLIVVDAVMGDPFGVTTFTVVDGNGNTYTATGALFNNTVGSGGVKRFHADNATTSTTMTGPTLTFSGTGTSDSTAVLYDVTGAATSPYDSTAGRATASGDQVSTAATFTGCTITPTNANSLIFTSVGVEFITANGISPGNFISAFPSPITNPDFVDQNNGWGVFNQGTAASVTFTWNETGTGGVGHFATTADVFMPPASGTFVVEEYLFPVTRQANSDPTVSVW